MHDLQYIADRNIQLKCWEVLCDLLSTLRKDKLSHNSKPQHVASLCIVLVTWPLQPFVFSQRQNNHDIYFASWGKTDTIFLIRVTWKFSECEQESELKFQNFAESEQEQES